MNLRRGVILLAVALCFAVPSFAQMMGQGPPVVRGVWSPTVGSGAAYDTERDGRKVKMEIAIVGREEFQGKPAHWLEMYFPETENGEMVMKTLVAVDGENTRVVRMIIQNPEMGAFEMPVGGRMMRGNQSQTVSAADVTKTGTLVGTESIETPAGTFECAHYRTADGADVWLAKDVGPWGMVKTVSPRASMTLTKVMTGVKTRVTGPVQKFDPGAMMPPPQ